MRKAAAEHLRRPEPDLASKIRKKCERLKESGWFGVIPELWPNAKYVYAIVTGSMMPYTKKLKHYSGGEAVTLVSAEYGSTESWIGANLEPLNSPEKVTFTVIPTLAYFEFIPVLRERDKNAILEAEQPVHASLQRGGRTAVRDRPHHLHRALPLQGRGRCGGRRVPPGLATASVRLPEKSHLDSEHRQEHGAGPAGGGGDGAGRLAGRDCGGACGLHEPRRRRRWRGKLRALRGVLGAEGGSGGGGAE